ncbi:hypothetical protein K501DRAFT_289653, partial [Backusella circina FSU 941]
MQLLSTINLSIVASLLLQSGRFVGATPLFGTRTDNAHSNGVSEETCQDLRITYPSTRSTGITYEDGSKHVIAWSAPRILTQLNITLIDNSNSENSIYVGTFGAKDGATDEIPISLGDNNAGEYHYHISGQGAGQFCETNSGNFKINKRTTDVHDNESGTSSVDDDNKIKTSKFKDYIDGLDQDIDKFIHKNKETETQRVTHKNDADPSKTNGNSWTGDGAHTNGVSQSTNWVSEDDQHSNKSDWTGDGSHTNGASLKDTYWVSDDEHTNGWTGDGDHVNAAVQDSEWVSEDQHSNGNSWNGDGSHVNLDDLKEESSEWQIDESDNEPAGANHSNGWTGDGSHVNLDDLKEESPNWEIVESDNEPAAATTPSPTHYDFTNTWEDTSDHVNEPVTHSDFTNTWEDTSNHVNEPVTHSDFTNTWEDTSNHVNEPVTHSDFTNTWVEASSGPTHSDATTNAWKDTSSHANEPVTHSDFTNTWEDTSDKVKSHSDYTNTWVETSDHANHIAETW